MSSRAQSKVQRALGDKLDHALSAAALAALQGPSGAESTTVAGEMLAPQNVTISTIGPSPFQPIGRPSTVAVLAVQGSLVDAGSPAALCADTSRMRALSPEARALATLVIDVAARGIEVPLVVRPIAQTPGGGAGSDASPCQYELISGHRRLAAARLAGLTHVPIAHRGPVADHVAATAVFRANAHREDFAPWHKAVLLLQLQRQLKAASQVHTVRHLAALLGCSRGRAAELLQFAAAFSPEVLRGIGNGDASRAQEALARLNYRTLRRLVGLKRETARIAGTRLALGWEQRVVSAAGDVAREATPVIERRRRRDGAQVITIVKPVAEMTAPEVDEVIRVLEVELEVLRTHRVSTRAL